MGKLMKVVPVREGHVLELTWAVPPSEKLYRQAPLSYLSHLLVRQHCVSISKYDVDGAAWWLRALSTLPWTTSKIAMYYVAASYATAALWHVCWIIVSMRWSQASSHLALFGS